MSIVEYRTGPDNIGGNLAENVTKVKDLNDIVRQFQAAVRDTFNSLPWYEYGKLDGVPVFTALGSNQLSFPATDLRETYKVGRQIRLQSTGGDSTVYQGRITKTSYTNGGNNVLELSLGTGVTLPPGAGWRVWLYVVDSLTGGSNELLLNSTGTAKIRLDGAGVEIWFDNKVIGLFRSDGLLVGKNTTGIRVPGAFIGINGTSHFVSSVGGAAALVVARETTAGAAVSLLKFTQNGVTLDGGVNSTGNGNLAFDPGVAS